MRFRMVEIPIRRSLREKGDLIMPGIVCDDMKMADGLFWPIPIPPAGAHVAAVAFTIPGEITVTAPDGTTIAAAVSVTATSAHRARAGTRQPVQTCHPLYRSHEYHPENHIRSFRLP